MIHVYVVCGEVFFPCPWLFYIFFIVYCAARDFLLISNRSLRWQRTHTTRGPHSHIVICRLWQTPTKRKLYSRINVPTSNASICRTSVFIVCIFHNNVHIASFARPKAYIRNRVKPISYQVHALQSHRSGKDKSWRPGNFLFITIKSTYGFLFFKFERA